jgi:hypothetical protein
MEKGRWSVQRVTGLVEYPNSMELKDGNHAQDVMVREPLHAPNVMAVEKHKQQVKRVISSFSIMLR